MSPNSDDKPRGIGTMMTLGLGGLATAILLLIGNQVKDMITPQVTRIAVVCVLLAVVAILAEYAVSWCWTQFYKTSGRVPDFRNLEPIFDDKMSEAEKEAERRASREEIDHWKGRINTHAMASALVGDALAGVACWKLLLQLGALPPGDWLWIFAIAWGIWGALGAWSSPYAWRIVFERVFPKASGGYYSKVGEGGKVGLKNAERPEEPTIYGRVPGSSADDRTEPGAGKGGA